MSRNKAAITITTNTVLRCPGATSEFEYCCSTFVGVDLKRRRRRKTNKYNYVFDRVDTIVHFADFHYQCQHRHLIETQQTMHMNKKVAYPIWSCDLFAQVLFCKLFGIIMTDDVAQVLPAGANANGFGNSSRNVRVNWFAVWFMMPVVM